MTNAEWVGDWVQQTTEAAIRTEGEWVELFLRANHADPAKHEIVRVRDPDEDGIRWVFLVRRNARLPKPGPDFISRMRGAWPACPIGPGPFAPIKD